MKAPLGRAKCSDVTHLIKVSTCRSFQGLYPLASALTNCDQFCTCEVNVCSDDIDPSLLPCTGVIRDRAWPLGAETDGSSSFWSEHKAPEHSLQSVVPVLNIDRSKALPRYRAIQGHTPPARLPISLFPFHLHLLSITSSVTFSRNESVLCSYLSFILAYLSSPTQLPLSCVYV